MPASPFALPPELVVATIASVHDELRQRLKPGPLEIDLGAVATVDLAGLQLLCALVRTAPQVGATIAWRGTSPALAQQAAACGLTAELGLPTEVAP